MPEWKSSDRRSRLPRDWSRIRARVFRRDGGQCVIPLEDGTRCPNAATDCDHIIPGDNHSLDNLQSLCASHHATKSAREGNAAMRAKMRANKNRFKREERHPGLL
jgi:5-methylcytosine-specific restriction protein A